MVLVMMQGHLHGGTWEYMGVLLPRKKKVFIIPFSPSLHTQHALQWAHSMRSVGRYGLGLSLGVQVAVVLALHHLQGQHLLVGGLGQGLAPFCGQKLGLTWHPHGREAPTHHWHVEKQQCHGHSWHGAGVLDKCTRLTQFCHRCRA